MDSQVLVSTLQLTDKTGRLGAGDVSVLPVPMRFDWLRYLDAKGMTAFFAELLETIWECQEASEWEKMGQLISAWKETAYLMQDPVLMARVRGEVEMTENIPYEVARAQLGI